MADDMPIGTCEDLGCFTKADLIQKIQSFDPEKNFVLNHHHCYLRDQIIPALIDYDYDYFLLSTDTSHYVITPMITIDGVSDYTCYVKEDTTDTTKEVIKDLFTHGGCSIFASLVSASASSALSPVVIPIVHSLAHTTCVWVVKKINEST